MRIECSTELGAEARRAWDRFLAEAQHMHPEQDPRFAEGLRAEGQTVVHAMGWRQDRLVAVGLFGLRPHPFLPGFFRHALAYSGPVANDPADLTDFVQGLRQAPAFGRVGAIRITPYWLDAEAEPLARTLDQAGWHPFETTEMRLTGVNDISGSAEAIAARLSQTGRRKLRKAEKAGFDVAPAQTEAEALDFLARLNAHRAPRGLRPIPQARFMAAWRQVYSTNDLGTLLVIRHQGRVMAGLLLHRGRDTAYFISSFQDDPALSALDNIRIAPFLLFQGMLWANRLGCRSFDLEGYVKDAGPDHPLYGIYRYKADLAPAQVARIPGRQMILHPAVYLTGETRSLAIPYLKTLAKRLRRRRKSAIPAPPAAD